MDQLFQWVSQPNMLSESSQHEQQRQTSSSLEDWSKERPSAMPQTGSIGVGPSSGTSSMDITDFTTLGDLNAAAPALLASPQTFYQQLTQSHNQYFLPSYPTLPYGTTAWSPIPLSTYSTLNGATSTSNPPANQSQQIQVGQQQSPTPNSPITQQNLPSQQQAHSQPNSQSLSISSQSSDSSNPQPIIIDPTLTLSGANPNLQPYGSVFASQPQRQQYPYTQTSLFIPQYYRQPSNATPQGTLSPQALMSPSTITINPTAFYGTQTSTAASNSQQPQQDSQAQALQRSPVIQQQPGSQAMQPQPQAQTQTQAPEPSPEEIAQRKARFYASIKPLLQSSAFTGAQAVNTLVDRISNNIQDADPSIRLEILTRIRDGAGNHYFRAWSENSRAMDITRDWLRAAYSANDNSPLIETVMPLLHIIDRLPLTVDTLKASKLGKLVVKLVKDPPSPAIKDMAANIERRWRQLVNAEGTTTAPNANSAEDSKSKKRKPSEPPAKPQPPQKKQALASLTTTIRAIAAKDVKDKAKPAISATAVKDAKSDSSFFSAPKPKPKLPSFKKAPVPVPVKKEENVAQPSSVDPFQEVLKTMKARRESPAVSTPPPTVNTPPQTNSLSKNGKKKKSVTWAPDTQLESVRLIERTVYDDDPQEGMHNFAHSLRDLDRGEGAALHAHIFEETVDWAEPSLIDRPAEIESGAPTRGERSQEKATQEQREQTALSAVYMTPQMIPDSPAEPAVIIPEEEVDKEVVTMICGESDSIFWSGGMPIEPVSHTASVADLVGQLANGGIDPALGGTHFNSQGLDMKSVGLDPSPTLSAVSALPQEQLQQLLQQLASYGPTGSNPSSSSSFNDIDPGFGAPQNQYANDYGQSYYDDNERERWPSSGGRGRGRGRGGFGRGRGGRGSEDYRQQNKRKPCSFFAAGKCKFGDQCDFAHEIVS